MSLGVYGTESRPVWLERMGEGRQGQRHKLGADHSTLQPIRSIRWGNHGPNWEEKRPPSCVKSERGRELMPPEPLSFFVPWT